MPSTSYSINTAWYLDVNSLARHSAWAHGVMEVYSHFLGLGLLALVLLVSWWWARHSDIPARAVGGVLWAAGGTVVAWLVAHFVLKPLVAERRPYLALHHVEVLLTRTHEYSFPSGHATVAGAVIVGLLLARRRVAATFATVLGLLLCFGRVYTGMHYPFDVLAGLVLGGLIVAIGWVVAVALLSGFCQLLLGSPLAPLVAARTGSPDRAGWQAPPPPPRRPAGREPVRPPG